MTNHNIKLREEFAEAVECGDKNFEIRKNDRGYQKGDIVTFNVIDKYDIPVSSGLDKKEYEITYVLNGYGLENGFVVFGIKEIQND